MRSALENALLEIINEGTCEGFGDVDTYGAYVSLVEDYSDQDWVVVEDSYGFIYTTSFDHIAISGEVGEGYYQPAQYVFDALRAEFDDWNKED